MSDIAEKSECSNFAPTVAPLQPFDIFFALEYAHVMVRVSSALPGQDIREVGTVATSCDRIQTPTKQRRQSPEYCTTDLGGEDAIKIVSLQVQVGSRTILCPHHMRALPFRRRKHGKQRNIQILAITPT